MIDSYTLEKWNNVHTVADFLSFCEDKKCDVTGMIMSLVDQSKSSYWLAANVQFNFPIDKILQIKPEIDWNTLSSITMHPTELEWHKKNNFTNGYDRIKPTKELHKIATALGFTESRSIWLNNQPPGAIMGRHVDSVSCFTYEQHDNFLQMEYDKKLRQPKEMSKIYRCFVALEDWQPGQIVNFEPGYWENWKKGDVVFFDWRNTIHSTANTGEHNRPLLKITGTIPNDTYITLAQKTGEVLNAMVL
jgi:hypothetical protein